MTNYDDAFKKKNYFYEHRMSAKVSKIVAISGPSGCT
jgi:hypothetical protein